MKSLIVALALVATACAFSMDEIPAHMRDRLDRYVAMKRQWRDKWMAMNDDEQKSYEQVLLARLDKLPQIELNRIHERVLSMPEEHRMRLREYLRRRFPVENTENEDVVEEIDAIVKSLPEMIRNTISNAIHVSFQEATAYLMNEEEIVDDELNFPDIPEIVDIPSLTIATGYSSSVTDDIRQRLDEFLLKREDWRIKWERLSADKKEVLERYINERLE